MFGRARRPGIDVANDACARRAGAVDSLGAHRLRDVPEPIEVFQLREPGIDSVFPPLRTLTSAPNNLPAATDRTIGRELEIVDVAETLTEHRLVTLIGPGGAGKTASLYRSRGRGGDRVRRRRLAGAACGRDDARPGAELTAQELHVASAPTNPLLASLQHHLARAAPLLIVLDNCEHLVDAVGVVR